MNEISLGYVFNNNSTRDGRGENGDNGHGRGDNGDKGRDGGSSKETVKPNHNVFINPYRKSAKGVSAEQPATVRNPYKTATSRKKGDFAQQQCMLSNTTGRSRL